MLKVTVTMVTLFLGMVTAQQARLNSQMVHAKFAQQGNMAKEAPMVKCKDSRWLNSYAKNA